MSKSGSLRVKNLFKVKSTDKENKELRRDGAAVTSPTELPGMFPNIPAPLSPGDGGTLPAEELLVSPKEKKGRRLLSSLKLKRKKSKRKEEEVFFPESDVMTSFNRHM